MYVCMCVQYTPGDPVRGLVKLINFFLRCNEGITPRYADRVLMPTICCLHKCSNLEELYLEKADSSAITTYLLAHTLKHLNQVATQNW